METCKLCNTEVLENKYNIFYHPRDNKDKICICSNCLKSDIKLLFLVKKYEDIIFEQIFSYNEIFNYIIGKSNSKI